MRKPSNVVDYLNNLFEEKTDNLQKETIHLDRISPENVINQPSINFNFKENSLKIKNEVNKNSNNGIELGQQERLKSSNDSHYEGTIEEDQNAPETRTKSESYSTEATKSNNKYNGWLKIKSESFINTRIFPNDQIKYDKDFFRINYSNSKQKEKFYFELTENFLQYKSEEKSSNLLQAIRTEAITNLNYYQIPYDNFKANFLHCADFSEKYDNLYTDFYKICSENLIEFNKFFCALAIIKSQKFPQCIVNDTSKPQTELILEIQNVQMIIPFPSKFCNENFSYKNHGEDWECLCRESSSQSPIDLPKPKNAILSALTPIFAFEEIPIAETLTTQMDLPKQTLPTLIKFENEVLKISKNNLAKMTTLNSELFIANDIIFHTPSEHKIEGKRFDIEMQVIYSSLKKTKFW